MLGRLCSFENLSCYLFYCRRVDFLEFRRLLIFLFTGLEFHLWEDKAIFILQRALPLEDLKVNGKLLRGVPRPRSACNSRPCLNTGKLTGAGLEPTKLYQLSYPALYMLKVSPISQYLCSGVPVINHITVSGQRVTPKLTIEPGINWDKFDTDMFNLWVQYHSRLLGKLSFL